MRKILVVAFVASLMPFYRGAVLAQDLEPEALVSPDVQKNENTLSEVANVSAPSLILSTPVVEDVKAKDADVSEDVKKKILDKKLDLKAVIFDPSADFKAQAEEEGREMTKEEIYKYKIHEALHGEVKAIDSVPLLKEYTTLHFDKGPIESITPSFLFRGRMSQMWTGENYANTLFNLDFADFIVDAKFRDGKTVFKLMVNPSRPVDNTTYMQSFLEYLYIQRQMTKNNKLLVGMTRQQVGLEAAYGAAGTPLFARSQVSRTYGNSFVPGIVWSGNYQLVDYSLAGASSTRWLKDFFPGPEFTGHVNFKPLAKTDGKYGKLALGGSLNAGNAESHYTVGMAHLVYEYKRLKGIVEYGSADGSNGSTGFTANRSEGFYGNLAYRVTPKLEAMVRYDQFDPNKDKANDRRTEYTAGLNYYLKGQALRIMLNYVYYTVENGAYGSRILVGTQILL